MLNTAIKEQIILDIEQIVLENKYDLFRNFNSIEKELRKKYKDFNTNAYTTGFGATASIVTFTLLNDYNDIYINLTADFMGKITARRRFRKFNLL